MDEWKIRFRREVKKEIASGWSFCRNMKGMIFVELMSFVRSGCERSCANFE